MSLLDNKLEALRTELEKQFTSTEDKQIVRAFVKIIQAANGTTANGNTWFDQLKEENYAKTITNLIGDKEKKLLFSSEGRSSQTIEALTNHLSTSFPSANDDIGVFKLALKAIKDNELKKIKDAADIVKAAESKKTNDAVKAKEVAKKRLQAILQETKESFEQTYVTSIRRELLGTSYTTEKEGLVDQHVDEVKKLISDTVDRYSNEDGNTTEELLRKELKVFITNASLNNDATNLVGPYYTPAVIKTLNSDIPGLESFVAAERAKMLAAGGSRPEPIIDPSGGAGVPGPAGPPDPAPIVPTSNSSNNQVTYNTTTNTGANKMTTPNNSSGTKKPSLFKDTIPNKLGLPSFESETTGMMFAGALAIAGVYGFSSLQNMMKDPLGGMGGFCGIAAFAAFGYLVFSQLGSSGQGQNPNRATAPAPAPAR